MGRREEPDRVAKRESVLLGDSRDHELLGHVFEHPQALPLRVRLQGPRGRPAALRVCKNGTKKKAANGISQCVRIPIAN